MKIEIELPLVGLQVMDKGKEFVPFYRAKQLLSEQDIKIVTPTNEIIRSVHSNTKVLEVSQLDDSEYKELTGIDRRSPEDDD